MTTYGEPGGRNNQDRTLPLDLKVQFDHGNVDPRVHFIFTAYFQQATQAASRDGGTLQRSRGKLVRQKRNFVGTIGPPQDRGTMVQLAAEMQQLTDDVYSQLGLRGNEKRQAASLAAAKRKLNTSNRILKPIHALSPLLVTWQRSAPYQGADGSPKVLPIRGPGASFQSLVKEFVPRMQVEEVLKLLVSQSDVRLVSGDKVAMLGSIAVMYPTTPEVLLAAMIARVRRLANTMLSNARNPSRGTGSGLYDRQVTARFTKQEWAQFSRAIRNQLDDLVMHVNEISEERPRKKDGKHNCGMSVFLWED
jgi:hypothetical protein